jgi:SAM-dependent methyltransferase
MEHFLDEDAACAEIRRVLKPGGYYFSLIHVAQSRRQELVQKVREYVFPIPRPLAMIRWVVGKLHRPIRQPIQLRFTPRSGSDCLQRNGLSLVRTITSQTEPTAPLIGPHVVVYVSTKLAA